jgi:nitroimidazol reductase NimA-like FMN-containing flavoprotein (pyridoxamine 5'-phosphate oxidase superfamily)
MHLFDVLHAPRRVILLIAALDMSPVLQQLVMCEHEVRDSLLTVPALGLMPRVAGRYGPRMDEALRSRILEVLQRQHIMTVATIRPDGYPQATTVNYIHDDLILYFASAATSQKAGNIKLNDKVSVAIVDRAQDFYKLRGLSMSGTAARVQEKQRAEEFALRLFSRLPQSRRFVPEDPKELAVYAIRPVAIALVDYASGFGTTHLVELWP